MMNTIIRKIASGAGISALVFATNAQAGFFIPSGVWMAMTTASPTEINTDLAYGFSRSVSGSVGLTRVKEPTLDTPGGSAWRNVSMLQGAYLVKRLSTDDGIGNAYVFGGPFVEKREQGGRTQPGVAAGVWLDYETRRIYSRLKVHGFKSETWRRNEVVGQLMWAPYAADYEDVASWGGVQIKRVSGERQTELTPYLRFFKKTWWVDAGMSVNRANRKDFFFNVMHTF
jgi:hypothetical protein